MKSIISVLMLSLLISCVQEKAKIVQVTSNGDTTENPGLNGSDSNNDNPSNDQDSGAGGGFSGPVNEPPGGVLPPNAKIGSNGTVVHGCPEGQALCQNLPGGGLDCLQCPADIEQMMEVYNTEIFGSGLYPDYVAMFSNFCPDGETAVGIDEVVCEFNGNTSTGSMHWVYIDCE